jgi:hypothetical protein
VAGRGGSYERTGGRAATWTSARAARGRAAAARAATRRAATPNLLPVLGNEDLKAEGLDGPIVRAIGS